MGTAAKTLIICRHGQTDYNLVPRVQGHVDIPLNQQGKQQALHAAEVLQKTPIVRIIASPLQRAAQTATAIAKPLGLTVEFDPRLQERNFGQWEGLTWEEIKTGWPKEYDTWLEGGNPAPENTGVESREKVGQRMALALQDFSAAMSPGQTILVVSHGSACTQGITTMLGINPNRWFGIGGMDNCHWACLQTSQRHPGWVLRGYNLGAEDTSL